MNNPDSPGSRGPARSVVSVSIGGEEYTLRAHASPEYTRECAAYLDRAVREILAQSSLIEPPKAVLLAALAIVDQLFQARGQSEAARAEFARVTAELADRVESASAASDLAPRP